MASILQIPYDDSEEIGNIFKKWLIAKEHNDSINMSRCMGTIDRFIAKYDVDYVNSIRNGYIRDFLFDVNFINETFEESPELLSKAFFVSSNCPDHIKVYLSLKFGFTNE